VLAGLVALMVIVGGATRLTDSGLSITEWKPITGAIPPLSAGDWQAEFEKYRQIPEYQQVNRGMSLAEFKTIYWWEWGHRFLGRFVGLVFLIPFLVLVATGHIRKAMMPRLIALFVLGGLQGAIGWWMVKSGLVERTDVSQYRLAVHLTMACIIFAALIWTIFSLSERAGPREPAGVRRGAGFVLVLIFIQIALGALVAGLDAGLTYNSWPLMDGDFIPSGLLMIEPWWLNLTENITTVQFDHRMVAYLLAVAGLAHAWQLWGHGQDGARRRAAALAIAIIVQILIGIATLVHVVPLSLGILHQFGALIVLAIAVWNLQASRGEARLIRS
jgi:cytochrome c oxidase assembly protein subunit 15